MPPRSLLLTADPAQLVEELDEDCPLGMAATVLSQWFDRAIEAVELPASEGSHRAGEEEAEREFVVHLLGVLRNSFFALSSLHLATDMPSSAGVPSARPRRSRLAQWRRADVDAQWAVFPHTNEPRAHTASLIRALSAALAAADRCVEDFASRPRQSPRWWEDEDLLSLVQDLLASQSAGDGVAALDRVASLRRELVAGYQIHAIDYDASRANMFQVETGDSAIIQDQTLAPALLQGDRVLRRGLARIPPEAAPIASDFIETSMPDSRSGGIGTGAGTDTSRAGEATAGVAHQTAGGVGDDRRPQGEVCTTPFADSAQSSTHSSPTQAAAKDGATGSKA